MPRLKTAQEQVENSEMEGHQADSEAEEDEEDSQFEERSDPGTHQEEKPK